MVIEGQAGVRLDGPRALGADGGGCGGGDKLPSDAGVPGAEGEGAKAGGGSAGEGSAGEGSQALERLAACAGLLGAPPGGGARTGTDAADETQGRGGGQAGEGVEADGDPKRPPRTGAGFDKISVGTSVKGRGEVGGDMGRERVGARGGWESGEEGEHGVDGTESEEEGQWEEEEGDGVGGVKSSSVPVVATPVANPAPNAAPAGLVGVAVPTSPQFFGVGGIVKLRCTYDKCRKPTESASFYPIDRNTTGGGRDWNPLEGAILCQTCYAT